MHLTNLNKTNISMEFHPFITGRWKENLDKSIQIQDKWFINGESIEDIKSFAFMPSNDVESIILGTFPIWEISHGPQTENNFEFFYGSRVNDLWNCLGGITNTNTNNLTNRIGLLDKQEIGITDILLKIERHPNDCNSDGCLTVLRYNDLLDLKEHYPKLKNLFITSGGKSAIQKLNENNKSVATWLKDAFRNNHKHVDGFNINGFVKPISINNKNASNIIYLYSPSNAGNIAIQGVLNRNNNFGFNNLTIAEFRKIQWSYFLNKYHSRQILQYGILNDQMINFFED